MAKKPSAPTPPPRFRASKSATMKDLLHQMQRLLVEDLIDRLQRNVAEPAEMAVAAGLLKANGIIITDEDKDKIQRGKVLPPSVVPPFMRKV